MTYLIVICDDLAGIFISISLIDVYKRVIQTFGSVMPKLVDSFIHGIQYYHEHTIMLYLQLLHYISTPISK